MALAYVSTGTHAQSNADVNTLDVPFTSTPTSGNTLVIFIENQRGQAWNTPSGWTAGPTVGGAAVFWKTATGSETGNQTVTKGGTIGECGGVMLEFSGANTSAAIHVSNTSSTSTVTTMTPTVPNTLFVWFVASNNHTSGAGSNFSTYAMTTDNPSWTERDDNGRNGQMALGVATASLRSAVTATGNCTVSASNCTVTEGIVFALAPFPNASISVPVATLSTTGPAPSITTNSNITIPVGTLSTTGPAPTVTAGVDPWTKTSKNTTTWTNTTEN